LGSSRKKSILLPRKGLESGVLEDQKYFKEIYEVQLEFPEGWGGLGKNPFPGGGMNIFWNYTLLRNKSKT